MSDPSLAGQALSKRDKPVPWWDAGVSLIARLALRFASEVRIILCSLRIQVVLEDIPKGLGIESDESAETVQIKPQRLDGCGCLPAIRRPAVKP